MNEFNVSGRCNYIEIKYTESGKCFTRVLVAEKQRNGEYHTYPVTLFNTVKDNTAENIAEEIKKGDYVKISGKLTIDKFTAKTGEEVERIGLVGFGYNKLVWDEVTNKFIEIPKGKVETEKFSEVEKTPSSNMFVNPKNIDLMDY